jgi:hypothetical protein
MITISFAPNGPVLSFTTAAAAPTSVQAITSDGVPNSQVVLTNTDTTNDCVVAWGQTDAQAKTNAVVANASSNCFFLLHNTQVVITAAPNAFYTGIAVAGSPIVKVQAGIGVS